MYSGPTSPARGDAAIASGNAATPGTPAAAGDARDVHTWRRMRRVLAFDRSVYPEVERDPRGMRQATFVVALAAAAAALGTVLIGSWSPGAIAGASLAALIHWMLWSWLDHLIVRAFFRTRTSLRQTASSLGYAQTPELLALFAFVPVAGTVIVVGSRLLTLVAGTQSLRTTHHLSRRQAFAVRLASFAIAIVGAALVRTVLGDAPFLRALLRP